MNAYKRSNLILLTLGLNCATARADFQPIALTPDSYNQEVVVEKTSPPPVVTADHRLDGNRDLQLGFHLVRARLPFPNGQATGIPEAGSILTSDLDPNHQYQMPPSYANQNAFLIDAVRTNAVLVLVTPTNCNVLSFLTSSGITRNQIDCTVHYANHTSETGTFTSPNWHSDGDPAWAANGHVNVDTFMHGDLNSYNPRLYSGRPQPDQCGRSDRHDRAVTRLRATVTQQMLCRQRRTCSRRSFRPDRVHWLQRRSRR